MLTTTGDQAEEHQQGLASADTRNSPRDGHSCVQRACGLQFEAAAAAYGSSGMPMDAK